MRLRRMISPMRGAAGLSQQARARVRLGGIVSVVGGALLALAPTAGASLPAMGVSHRACLPHASKTLTVRCFVQVR
jgi:hypothetical protein